MDYKTLISERISEVLKMDKESVVNLIEVPSKEEMGDFAFPCFKLAKILRKAPNNIALNILDKINKDGFDKVEVIGAYLNFFVDKKSLTENTLNEILEKGDKYGSSDVGKGKNITIDYSSPNIAKPFHIGHLSTTVIGNSLYRLFKFAGYNSIGINHLGDWGTQFGKLIAAYNRWIDEDALENDPIKELLRIYVKFHAEAEKEPSLNDEARLHFKRLEEGAKEETALWKRFKDLSLREFNKVYDKLNIHFDHFTGESFYSDKMGAVVDELEKKGLLTESRGAEVVMLDKYNMPPCIIKKSDGATIYATRDLAAAIYRKKTYDFYKNIYVVGTPQALHFKQVFTTLKLMGYKWADDCKHVGFGLVKFKDKKLATRTGDVIFLDDLLNEAVSNILEIINKKNPELKDKEKVAEKVGVGAVIFAYLKNSREKDIVFSWNEMLSFEGETGPYVQYTYARGKSILRKAEGIDLSSVDLSKLTLQEETDIVKLLSVFNHAVMNAIERYEPSIVTRYVIDVAEAFNKFYNQVNILNCDDEEAKKARLVLTKATCQVIKNALSLLGIDVVERM